MQSISDGKWFLIQENSCNLEEKEVAIRLLHNGNNGNQSYWRRLRHEEDFAGMDTVCVLAVHERGEYGGL